MLRVEPYGLREELRVEAIDPEDDDALVRFVSHHFTARLRSGAGVRVRHPPRDRGDEEEGENRQGGPHGPASVLHALTSPSGPLKSGRPFM